MRDRLKLTNQHFVILIASDADDFNSFSILAGTKI